MITRSGYYEVLVITGCCLCDYKIVQPRSYALVLPGQHVHRFTETMTVKVETKDVVTKIGVPVSIVSMVQVRIDTHDEPLLRTFCEKFVGKSEDEVKKIVCDCIAPCQTSVMANFAPEDLKNNMKNVCQAVFEEAKKFTDEFGLNMVSFSIKKFWDDQGYFMELGRARQEEIIRDALAGKLSGLMDPEKERQKVEELRLRIEKEEQEVVEEMRLEEEREAQKKAADEKLEDEPDGDEEQFEDESDGQKAGGSRLKDKEKRMEEMKLLVEREAQEVMEEMRLEEEREVPHKGGDGKLA